MIHRHGSADLQHQSDLRGRCSKTLSTEYQPTVLARSLRLMALWLAVSRVDKVHLYVLANGRRVCIGGMSGSEVDRAEMGQVPLLPAVRVRGPFQRDRESHGQYRIEAAE